MSYDNPHQISRTPFYLTMLDALREINSHVDLLDVAEYTQHELIVLLGSAYEQKQTFEMMDSFHENESITAALIMCRIDDLIKTLLMALSDALNDTYTRQVMSQPKHPSYVPRAAIGHLSKCEEMLVPMVYTAIKEAFEQRDTSSGVIPVRFLHAVIRAASEACEVITPKTLLKAIELDLAQELSINIDLIAARALLEISEYVRAYTRNATS